MTVVAVTGAAGYLGRLLCESLDERAGFRRVVGIDVAEPGFTTGNLEFYRLDVRSAALKEVLRGCDVLVHLAFRLASRDLEEMRDVNVNGTENALVAAAEAGVRKVVVTSSAMAYGAHPDNDVPLTEQSPIRPVRDFPYSVHKAEVEGIVATFRASHPEITVTVLRPCFVLGPAVAGVVARLVEAPWLAGVEGYNPPVQFLHEADAVRALRLAVERDLDGAFNVCPDAWLPQDRAAELAGRRRVVLDYETAFRRADRLWRWGLTDIPPSFLSFVMYPWVMSGQRLRQEGFEPLHSPEAALLAAAEARRGWVSVGRVRFRPRRLVAAAALAAAAGALWRRQPPQPPRPSLPRS